MASPNLSYAVSDERLRALGKEASDLYHARRASMTDAVIAVLQKEAGISSEHVKRIVGYANNDAYRRTFEDMRGDHRIVNLEGGPADPGPILRELDMTDSAPMIVKSASNAEAIRPFIPGEDEFEGFFDREKTASAAEELPAARPHGELIDLRDNLLTVRSVLRSKLASAELEYDDAANQMYNEVKQQVLNGTSPAEVSVIYQRVAPSPEFTKIALRVIQERMEPEQIPAVPMSREKVKEAASRLINEDHPIAATFLSFSKTAATRLVTLGQLDEVDTQLKRVNVALKEVMQ